MNKNPCSNQEIRVLFEHGSELESTFNEPCIICMTLCGPDCANVFVREDVEYGYDVVTTL